MYGVKEFRMQGLGLKGLLLKIQGSCIPSANLEQTNTPYALEVPHGKCLLLSRGFRTDP